MVSHHPAKFDDHMHCGSGGMFLVVEGQDFTWSRFYPPLLFSLKHMVGHVCTYKISQ